MRQSTVSAMRQALVDNDALQKFSDARRMKMLRLAAEMGHFNIDEVITQRGRTVDRLMACQQNGKVFVEVWQRDCDCAEWTSKVEIDATYMAFQNLRVRTHDDAEGPYTLYIMTPSEAAEWQRSSRDRALEAFENGNSYSV